MKCPCKGCQYNIDHQLTEESDMEFCTCLECKNKGFKHCVVENPSPSQVKREEKEYTLKDTEFHPAAADAMEWFKEYQIADTKNWMMMKEAIFSTALSGNRMSEIMSSTINRLDAGEPVSDRYLLGLCWFLLRNSLKIPNAK